MEGGGEAKPELVLQLLLDIFVLSPRRDEYVGRPSVYPSRSSEVEEGSSCHESK